MKKIKKFALILMSSASLVGLTGICNTTAFASELNNNTYDILNSIKNDTKIIEESKNSKARAYSRSRAYSKNKRYTYKRGSWAAWSKDIFDFDYANGKITRNSQWQDSGWVIPNIVREKGITYVKGNSSSKQYRAKKTFGIGVPSPWGDVKITNQDFNDYITITGYGNFWVN